MTGERFAHDAFFIDQLIRPMANLYRISTLGLDGSSAGEPLAFVRQKKLALKEDIRFYADESQQQELFRIKARQMFELKARYDVTGPKASASACSRRSSASRSCAPPGRSTTRTSKSSPWRRRRA